MMTKKQFAKCIIAKELDINLSYITDSFCKNLKSDIYGNTNIGIALETLGYIDDENDKNDYEYLQSRGGIMYTFFDNDTGEAAILSLREILSFLPDEIKEEV